MGHGPADDRRARARARSSPTWLRLRGLHLHVSRLRPTPEAFELAADLIADLHRGAATTGFGWQPELLDFGGGYPHERDPESGAPSAQPRRRHSRGVRGGRHLDAAHGAGRALAPRAPPPARAGPTPRQQRDRPAHPRRRRQAAADRVDDVGQRRREHEPLPARRAPGLLLRDRPRHEGRDGGRRRGERRRPDVRGRPARRAAVAARASSRATCSRCWTSAATRRCSSSQFNLLPRPATVLVDGDAADVIRRRETLDDLLATQLVRPGSPHLRP